MGGKAKIEKTFLKVHCPCCGNGRLFDIGLEAKGTVRIKCPVCRNPVPGLHPGQPAGYLPGLLLRARCCLRGAENRDLCPVPAGTGGRQPGTALYG